MKYINLILSVIVTLCLTISCSDFLEEKSQEENVPSSVSDYREILLNYQRSVISSVILIIDDDVMIDETTWYGTDENATAATLGKFFTWQPDMWEETAASGVTDNYTSAYENIMAMNVILEKLDDAEGEMDEKNIVRAQALGVRSWCYFILVNTFAEPYNSDKEAAGVVLKFETTYSDAGMPRSSVKEVYDRIVSDLEEASSILSEYPKTRGDFLINSTAIDILLSRVYLYMEEWDKVVETANRAIETSGGLFDYTTIPEGEFFYMASYDNPEVEWLPSSVSVPNMICVSGDLYSQFDVNDRRQEFLESDNGWWGKSIAKTSTESGGPNIMFRSAEAYLNRAEAKVLSGTPDLVGALADLNELRRHRITGYSDVNISDAGTLLEEIRKERRKELCFEGHRWFDLRRYGMPSIYHDFRTSLGDPYLRYTLREEDPLYTLPIPAAMLENNVRLQQNASATEPERDGRPIN